MKILTHLILSIVMSLSMIGLLIISNIPINLLSVFTTGVITAVFTVKLSNYFKL